MKKLLIVSLIIIASLGQIRGEVNKPPAFENASYSYFVFENVPINTPIASVFLNRRSGTPGDIRCYDLNTIGKFSIQRVFISSVLTVYANGSKTSATPPVKLLPDRLVWNASIHGTVQHVVRLTVEDGGGLNDSTLVNITVKDVNEPPVCDLELPVKLYQVSIFYDIGENITVVKCFDPDFDISFKTLYYSSAKIYDYTYFNVSASGEVTLAALIPRDAQKLKLMIVAQDGGGLLSNVTILFEIRDYFKFHWESSSLLPNGRVVQACVGDNVTFPWAFSYSTLYMGMIYWNPQWDWESEDKKKRLVLAFYAYKRLFKQRGSDVEFLPNAGLKLPKVKLANAGLYTISIYIEDLVTGFSRNYKQTAFLRVSDFVFDWKSSSLFPNGTVVQACVGDNVSFPWVFNMTSSNPVLIQWNWNSEGEKKKLVLASYRQYTFKKVVPKRDLEFLPNAGLMLPKVTFADAGLYNIDIEIDGCLQSKRYTQAAFLRVSDFVFDWKSSSLFRNGTVVQACVGDNVTFPWMFNMTSSNPILIQWIWNSEDEKRRLVLASYSQNTFNKVVTERDLEFLPNAGLMLPKVTLADSGLYNIDIEIDICVQSKRYTQVASLNVIDMPVELHAFILPGSVYNTTTGLWYVQLGCRPQVTREDVSLPVIWTTPSNQSVISTSYNNNIFMLELPLSMEEGDYSCSVNRSSAVKCFNTHLSTRRAATVNLNSVNIRLAYLEGSVEKRWKETDVLNSSLCNLTDIVQQLQTKDKKCDEEIINLNQTIERFNGVLQNLQTQIDKMTSKVNCLGSITTTANNKYDNMTVMVLSNLMQSKFDEIAVLVQRNNDSIVTMVKSKCDNITGMVQRNNDNITAMVQSKFENIRGMVQRNNDNITAIVQSIFVNITGMVKIHNDNITNMVQSKFDKITAVAKNNDNITTMVQRNNDNIVMIHSNLDTITTRVQGNNYNITDMDQSKLDTIITMVQRNYDDIAMVQSKLDTVYAIILQLQAGLIELLKIDRIQRPASCVDVQKYNNLSGVHTLFLNGSITVKVFCDQSTDNGGWTVIQRRRDGTGNFKRNWVQYEVGFGDLNGEFWIGLANMHLLTRNKNYKLRIDLRDHDDNTAYAMYDTFSINAVNDSYRLNVGGYSGTAGDSLSAHNNMKFSTFDRDHDIDYSNCAERFRGGWWYNACHASNLNGHYKPYGGIAADGVNWWHWKGSYNSLKRVDMKIRL